MIRHELPEDVEAVRAVVAAAFADPAAPGVVPVEAGLVDALRATDSWLPALALVAETESEIVGYVVCTRSWIGPHPSLGLGPLAVAPDRQRRGVGAALMNAVLDAANGLDEPLVVLLGHTDYYPRFGFRRASELGIEPPEPAWGAHFQARPMRTYDPAIRGTFRYAQPFNDL